MIGIVLVGHYQFAQELYTVVKSIIGEVEHMCSVNVAPSDPPEESIQRVGRAIKQVDTGNGVLILTDMFGGTPSNLSLSFLSEGKVEVVTGVNLPMVIRLATIRREGKSLSALAQELKDYGQRNICIASEILTAHIEKEG